MTIGFSFCAKLAADVSAKMATISNFFIFIPF
jgi:hypothetical protein